MQFKKGQPGISPGRPKGSKSKPRLTDYMSEEEITQIVHKARDLALKGNETMIKLILEQKFGKAVQAVEGDVTGNLTIKFDNAFKQ